MWVRTCSISHTTGLVLSWCNGTNFCSWFYSMCTHMDLARTNNRIFFSCFIYKRSLNTSQCIKINGNIFIAINGVCFAPFCSSRCFTLPSFPQRHWPPRHLGWTPHYLGGSQPSEIKKSKVITASSRSALYFWYSREEGCLRSSWKSESSLTDILITMGSPIPHDSVRKDIQINAK